jgi:hypothetical protein
MEQILYGFIGLFILWAKTPNVFMGKKVVNSVQEIFPTVIWNDSTVNRLEIEPHFAMSHAFLPVVPSQNLKCSEKPAPEITPADHSFHTLQDN